MIDKQSEVIPIWYKYILTKGKFDSLSERACRTKQALFEYFDNTAQNFISNNTAEFIEFLENNLGPIEFTAQIAMKVNPTELFVNGWKINL